LLLLLLLLLENCYKERPQQQQQQQHSTVRLDCGNLAAAENFLGYFYYFQQFSSFLI